MGRQFGRLHARLTVSEAPLALRPAFVQRAIYIPV
jgi:hypothetical protein